MTLASARETTPGLDSVPLQSLVGRALVADVPDRVTTVPGYDRLTILPLRLVEAEAAPARAILEETST